MFNAGLEPTIVPVNLTGAQTTTVYVVEAWTDRSDLGVAVPPARLLATSATMLFSFNDLGFSTGLQFHHFEASEVAPGWLTVRAQPSNASVFRLAKSVTWAAFQPTGQANARGRPLFSLDTALLNDKYRTREFPQPAINASFSQPGLYFLGIYGAWNGEYGFSFPKPGNGIRTLHSFPLVDNADFQPFAIVIPFTNGSVPALPRGFAGPVHICRSIPGDQRLALKVRRITVFDGGTVHIPLLHGAPTAASAPEWIELELPEGMDISPPGRWSYENDYGASFTDVTHVSNQSGGGSVAAGYNRLRLGKEAGAAWGFHNLSLRLRFTIAEHLVGRVFPVAKIRGYTGALVNRARTDNWQPLALVVKALTPVTRLPRRLHTDFCWASFDEFSARPASPGLSSLALSPAIRMWQNLGFTVVPTVGVGYAQPPADPGTMLSPSNRSDWNASAAGGLKYSIMIEPFATAGFSAPPHGLGCFDALMRHDVSNADSAGSDGFNFTAAGLTAKQEAVEREKWRDALVFYRETGMMDLSYDGLFYRNDLATIGKLVAYSQPDFFNMDSELFPEFSAWSSVGYTSKNFQRRQRLSGEPASELSVQISQGWM
jgi:hypothetical protein